jgi:putative membrane protein
MHGFLGTKADFWWDMTLTTETIVVAAFVTGFVFARRHQGFKHQKAMLVATVLVTAWLAMYVAQQVIAGISGFDGPETVKYVVYLPIIIFHSLVSTLAVLLSVYQIYSGFKWSRFQGGDKVLAGPGASRHRKLGKVTLLAYLASVCTAYMVYLMLFVIYAPLRNPEYGSGEAIGVVTAIVAFAGGAIVAGAAWLSRKARVTAPGS